MAILLRRMHGTPNCSVFSTLLRLKSAMRSTKRLHGKRTSSSRMLLRQHGRLFCTASQVYQNFKCPRDTGSLLPRHRLRRNRIHQTVSSFSPPDARFESQSVAKAQSSNKLNVRFSVFALSTSEYFRAQRPLSRSCVDSKACGHVV